MVLSLALFVGTVRAARLGGDAVRAASVLAVWSFVYVISCPLVGRWVTARNARRLVLAGCTLLTATLGLLALAEGFVFMLILMGWAGIGAALFWPSFQIFMKDTDTAGGRSLPWSTGLYTFAWSTGYACGPFISGFLMQAGGHTTGDTEGPGWRIAFLFGAAVCLIMSIGLAAAARERGAQSLNPEGREPGPVNGTYGSMPDRVWLGWLGAVAGFATLAFIRSVFPTRALGSLQISEGMLGSIFFVLSMTQALVGLAMIRSRFWMYRALPIAGFAAAGVAGLLCFGLGERPIVLLAGAVLFGVFSGSFCFSMVFHALVHPRRAGRYVAINESLVGVTGFLAPLLGGAMADAWGFRVSGMAAVALVAFLTALQVWVSRTTGKPATAQPAGSDREGRGA
jgi:MFS family permease